MEHFVFEVRLHASLHLPAEADSPELACICFTFSIANLWSKGQEVFSATDLEFAGFVIVVRGWFVWHCAVVCVFVWSFVLNVDLLGFFFKEKAKSHLPN